MLLVLLLILQVHLEGLQGLLQLFAHQFDLVADEAQLRLFVTHEAQHQVVDGPSHEAKRVVLQDQVLELVVNESLLAEGFVLMADVSEDGGLRRGFLFNARLSEN